MYLRPTSIFTTAPDGNKRESNRMSQAGSTKATDASYFDKYHWRKQDFYAKPKSGTKTLHTVRNGLT